MISVVIPCYNETDVLELTYQTVIDESHDWGEPIELVLVDDGSQDDTWQIIQRLAAYDSRVRGVRLSRNFGHQAALGAGLAEASGEAVLVLDADLQDPPSLAKEMIRRWRQGYHVVYGRRTRRNGESVFKKSTGFIFYRMLSRMTEVDVPQDTGDFALLDAAVVRQLLRFKEHALFWRGLRCWTGFKHTAVYFDRAPRAGGETKYTLRKLLQLASSGLLSFSTLPLRLGLYLGGALTIFTLLLATGGAAYVALVENAAWPFSWGLLATLTLGSTQLLLLGVIGEYLNRIYDEVRDRPRWVVQDSVGAEDAAANETDSSRKAA